MEESLGFVLSARGGTPQCKAETAVWCCTGSRKVDSLDCLGDDDGTDWALNRHLSPVYRQETKLRRQIQLGVAGLPMLWLQNTSGKRPEVCCKYPRARFVRDLDGKIDEVHAVKIGLGLHGQETR